MNRDADGKGESGAITLTVKQLKLDLDVGFLYDPEDFVDPEDGEWWAEYLESLQAGRRREGETCNR